MGPSAGESSTNAINPAPSQLALFYEGPFERYWLAWHGDCCDYPPCSAEAHYQRRYLDYYVSYGIELPEL
jgi:hypothetical protein